MATLPARADVGPATKGAPVPFTEMVDVVSKAIEVVGIAVILVGGIRAFAVCAQGPLRRRDGTAYPQLRRDLGRTILLGLEILVAADIVRTIGVSPTFTSVGVLGLIVVVRTFLSFSLEVEIDGRWPWRAAALRRNAALAPAAGDETTL